MRIYTMTATFGKLEHATLTLEPGLNIIQAPNEWGKSTWCAFLVAMLYGIDSRAHSATKAGLADKTRYDPWSGQLMSGRIELCWNGRDITIERSSTKRSQFRQFNAFETATGAPVPELTAENCGQQLLGVEKEVFQRAGFIRLSDMPVTQNDALRRRLNALVTTGDESGAADKLGAQLNKLKNECRANRSNGLLPQAQAQRDAVAEKLQQLHSLQSQWEKLQTRRSQLETYQQALQNHRQALDYADNQTYAARLAQAEAGEEAAAQKVQTLEHACTKLSDLQATEQTLLRLRRLREQRDSAHMEAQMLPPPPQPPQIIEAFCGLTEQDALRQAETDAAVCKQALKEEKRRLGEIVGFLFAIMGILLLLIPHWTGKCVGLAAVLVGMVLCRIQWASRRTAAATADALSRKYHRLPPETWPDTVGKMMCQQTQFDTDLAQHQAQQQALAQRTAQLQKELDDLTQGQSPAEYEAALTDALNTHKALADARREQRRAADLVQTLRLTRKDVSPPTQPDTLTHSREDTSRLLSDCATQRNQLQMQMGRCQGQMEALGQESVLQHQMQALQQRIVRLETVLAALNLAQETLSAATAQLQRRFAPRICQRAKALFSRMTAGRYDRLSLTEDLSLQASTAQEDTLRSILWRSEGTVDQLYLALRLAVAEELTPEAPLVLDDALVRFDDTRLKAAMDILREASRSRQVILFTCQSREKDLPV